MSTDYPYQNTKYFKQYKSEALQVIFDYPIQWTLLKTKLFFNYWFSKFDDVATPNGFNFLHIIPLLTILWLSISCLINVFTGNYSYIFSIFVLSVIVCLFVPQFVLHFEARYFTPIKFILAFLFLGNLVFKKNENA